MNASEINSRHNILIIDERLTSRKRLREVCQSLGNFEHIDQVSDLHLAIPLLMKSQKIKNIIFISSGFDSEEISSFITNAKTIPSADEAAFIMMKRMDEELASSELELTILGAHGFLFEPYSNESLKDVCSLSLEVRKLRIQEKFCEHLKTLVNDILVVLNHIAFLQNSNFVYAPALKQFRRLTALTNALPEDQSAIYYKELEERLKNPPPSGPYPVRYKYRGKSIRARKRLQKKALLALGYDVTGL
jgi:hypothetical protein